MDFYFLLDYQDEFIKGIETTLMIAAAGLVLSLLVGSFLALIRMSPYRWLQRLSKAYVAFSQNVPLLVIVFFFYYGLPVLHIELSEMVCGLIGLIVYNAAFVAEQLRAGIQAVPKGQLEAAAATGLNYIQQMRFVILPQAIRVVIPAIGNQMVNIVKGTSVLGLIAGGDIMYHADSVSSQTFLVFDVYLIVALFYLLVNIPLNILVRSFERRWQIRRI